jgi:translation initiation factor 2B subunit (eIF-2B alpha/beta/delta family)
VTDFATDRRSGSSDVAAAFLSDLRVWAAADSSRSLADLRSALLAKLRVAQASQPAMALVHHLTARALMVADAAVTRGESVADARRHLELSCISEMEDLVATQAAVARQAAELLTERGAWIATLSYSGTVRDALLVAQAAGREPRALIAESRPLFEGRVLAETLGAAGIPVWLVVDAALPLLLSQARIVWLGADAVTDYGVLNKIGSFAATLAAREHSVPVYALAPRRKFLPASTRALRIPEMPPAEVWEQAPSTVHARNVYFELTPLNLLRGVAVEDAVLPPTEAAQLARERALPDELTGSSSK